MFVRTSTRSTKLAPSGDCLEVVGVRRGLSWISDAGATSPGRTVAALEALEGPVLLIGGGRYGGQPLGSWARAAGSRCTHVLLFGSGGEVMASALLDHGSDAVIVRCADLDDATLAAARLARRGDTVLFSPACDPDTARRPTPAERFRDLATMPRAARAEAA